MSDDKITIKIPVKDIEELWAYQKSLMLLLSKIDVSEADEATVKCLEKVYELLKHITPEQSTSDSLAHLRFLSGD